MFSYYNPITYNTDVNSLVLNYFTGVTQGCQPYYDNPFGGFNINSLYTLGNAYFQPYQNCGYSGWNIFTNPNWCNWQDDTNNTGNNWNYYTPCINIFKLGAPSYDTNTISRNYSTPKQSKITPSDNKEKVTHTDSNTKVNTNPQKAVSSAIGKSLLTNANKYMGLNEKDGSWRKISNHPEWCADFIYHVVDETYKQQGKSVPKGLEKELPAGRKNHRVEEIKQWGIDNGKFFQTANKANKGKLIAENIKPGDILILREDGASHTGFVTKVNSDGTFETIEGNRNDKVCKAKYSPNYHEISGFVQLS